MFLVQRSIKFFLVHAEAPCPILYAAREACCIITDCSYTRLVKYWKKQVADEAPVAVIEVEGEVVVPARLLMGKYDEAAATFRPRLNRFLDRFLVDVEIQTCRISSLDFDPVEILSPRFALLSLEAGVESVLAKLDLDRSVPRVRSGGDAADEALRGGTGEATRHLKTFLLHIF